MDNDMHATPTADMELEQRLDAYARARLSLAPDAATRMRARIMGEARQTLATSGESPALSIVGASPISAGGRLTRTRLRRGGALLLAAGLAVGVLGGTAAAAQPGGPLYGARVWVEDVTLPADPSQRAGAELRRLEARMAEIEAAAQSGNQNAVAAAIAAYSDIADEALGAAGTDASLLDRLRQALDRHLAVLRAVAASVPAEAQAAIGRTIDRAVQHNDATLVKIGSRTSPPNPGQGGAANPQPGTNQKPAANPTPAATPDQSKKPHPTTKPVTPTPSPVVRPTQPPPPAHPAGKPSPKPKTGNGG